MTRSRSISCKTDPRDPSRAVSFNASLFSFSNLPLWLTYGTTVNRSASRLTNGAQSWSHRATTPGLSNNSQSHSRRDHRGIQSHDCRLPAGIPKERGTTSFLQTRHDVCPLPARERLDLASGVSFIVTANTVTPPEAPGLRGSLTNSNSCAAAGGWEGN